MAADVENVTLRPSVSIRADQPDGRLGLRTVPTRSTATRIASSGEKPAPVPRICPSDRRTAVQTPPQLFRLAVAS